VLHADADIRCIRAGSGGDETDFLPQITSYDYSAPISEAGGTGQPGIGGADKFAARGPAPCVALCRPCCSPAALYVYRPLASTRLCRRAFLGILGLGCHHPCSVQSQGPFAEGALLHEGLTSGILAGCGQLMMRRPVACGAGSARCDRGPHRDDAAAAAAAALRGAVWARGAHSERAAAGRAACAGARRRRPRPHTRAHGSVRPAARAPRPRWGRAWRRAPARDWGPVTAHVWTGAPASLRPATNRLPGRGRRTTVTECDLRQAATASWQEPPGSAWNRPPCTLLCKCMCAAEHMSRPRRMGPGESAVWAGRAEYRHRPH
jgi:hypothetical protein